LPTRRSSRRRDEYDICPKCDARMERGVPSCVECGAEFEPENDDRPWERKGAERRDSEPHRGGQILTMGIVSICLPALCFCPVVGLIASLLGFGLGVASILMGGSDLAKIDQNVMSHEGRGTTVGGRICGMIGAALSLFGALIGIFVIANRL
jgi:hypothetical protein